MMQDWYPMFQERDKEVERLEAELANLRIALEARDDQYEEDQAELTRLREENASLVDRHNRESHGTASHEAMAYDQVVAELARLRENYDTVFKDWKDAEVHAARLRERVKAWEAEADLLEAEIDRLRDENRRLLQHMEYGENPLTAELTRLREQLKDCVGSAGYEVLSGLTHQRDTLLAALRNLLDDTQHDEHHCTDPVCPVRIARTAISEYEVEGEK